MFGAREAAWPLIRADLKLSYAAVGLLLSVPGLVAALVEPVFGLLADGGRRRVLIVGGGIAFQLALVATALAHSFVPLLLALLLMYPASGAFVSLSQATMIDLDPARGEQNMARWTLAGSVGVVAGPAALLVAIATGAGWRGLFVALAVLIAALIVATHRARPPSADPVALAKALRAALTALRSKRVVGLLVLLELQDLMGDVLTGFLALYLVDVGRLTPAIAAVGVGVWAIAILVGDALLVPVLERMPGPRYLRRSAIAALAIYPAFLLVPSPAARLALLAALGLTRAGWYAVPKGRLFAELPGTSGVAVALASVGSLLGYLSPLVIGLLAQRFGLGPSMWLPLVAPVAVLVGLRWMSDKETAATRR